MKKLIYLLPILLLAAGCSKPDTRDFQPLVPYGTFEGKFTHTYTDPGTSATDVTTATVNLVMTTTGYALTSNTDAVHANTNGEFLGDERNIEFSATTAPADGKTYLHGTYLYSFDGSAFKLVRQSGADTYLYELVKKN